MWTAADQERLAVLLRWETEGESLREFIANNSPHLKPVRHLEPVLDLFERTRRERVRAVVAMPPRHGKTVTALHGVGWRTKRDPALRSAYATYGSALSLAGSRTIRRIAQNSGVAIAKDAAALHDWRTEHDGGVIATGRGGPLTGKGITGIALVDDTLKNRKEAESRKIRDDTWEWFTDVVWTRLEGDASCICIGTMWHPDDLLNRLLTRGAGEDGVEFELIRMPAICDDEDDLLGRQLGEALWDKYGNAKLNEIRALLGEYSFASLYQQRPRPRGSQLFKEPGRFTLADFKLDGHRICICADPAATAKTSSDYTAGIALAMKGHGADEVGWLLGHIRGQWEMADNPLASEDQFRYGSVGRLKRMQLEWGGVAVVVEAVAGFKAVPQMLRALDPTMRIVEAPADGDKFTRAQLTASMWNSGRMLVPTDAPWAAGLIRRFQAFTGNDDPEDDEIDALSHGTNAMHVAAPSSQGARRNANAFG